MYKKLSVHEFRENLAERHGKEFLNDMDGIFQGRTTLKSIGSKYGLSKMRITQLFERLYGSRLRDVKKVGFAVDSAGIVYNYEKMEKKKLIAQIPEWLYDKVVDKSKRAGITISDIAVDALILYFTPQTEADKHRTLFR